MRRLNLKNLTIFVTQTKGKRMTFQTFLSQTERLPVQLSKRIELVGGTRNQTVLALCRRGQSVGSSYWRAFRYEFGLTPHTNLKLWSIMIHDKKAVQSSELPSSSFSSSLSSRFVWLKIEIKLPRHGNNSCSLWPRWATYCGCTTAIYRYSCER